MCDHYGVIVLPARVRKPFLEEAEKIGQSTVHVIEILLKRTEYVEHGYRTARGIMSLAENYPAERLEKSCELVLRFKNVTTTAIKSILQQGIDHGTNGFSKNISCESIAHQTCRMEFEALKMRCPILIGEIHAAKGTSTYLKLLKKF